MSARDAEIQRYLDSLRSADDAVDPAVADDLAGGELAAEDLVADDLAGDELAAYQLLYRALAAEPEGSLPTDFVDRVVARTFPAPERRLAIEEILSPLLAIGIATYMVTWMFGSPSLRLGLATAVTSLLDRMPLTFLGGTAAAFAVIWFADRRLMPSALQQLRAGPDIRSPKRAESPR